MKQSREIMGMPVFVEIVDPETNQTHFDKVFDYLIHIDTKFSTYKTESEISQINRGEISLFNCSNEMKEVFDLSEETKKLTSRIF